MSAVKDGALVLGWHHSTRSSAAHCFEDGYPLCQDSDPGTVIDQGVPGRGIGRTCETCRLVYKSRILHAIRRARLTRLTHHSCTPMGVNARGVAQCADGHGDYPDACDEATP